jgi:hypothetical protein
MDIQIERKTETTPLDGTPNKRMFWSLLSDYDLKTSITELTDNSIDLWLRNGKEQPLFIKVDLDTDRQLITLSDNAGGVQFQDMRLLITPGGSNNDPYLASIGVFGVGSKRAVVALAQLVTIKTRHASSPSFQIDIDDAWLESDTWELPLYEIPPIDPGCTEIELSRLRIFLDQSDPLTLIQHLGETYAAFLSHDRCCIEVNGINVEPIFFDDWAFPEAYEPRRVMFPLTPDREHQVIVEIKAGLLRERNPIEENYGVNIYCNDRLVVKHLRSREVGYFVTGEAGVPHPDISLCRVNVAFAGPARLMPWNSSKTGLNVSHSTFQAARPTIVKLVTLFSKTSRALKDVWQEDVFTHATGDFVETTQEEALDVKSLILPRPPRSRKAFIEQLRDANAEQIDRQPWTVGLLEAVAGSDVLRKQRFSTRNRMALILLDSNFEIALKEFIVHDADLSENVNLRKLFGDRDEVIRHIGSKIQLDPQLLIIAKHYYQIRNKIIHERATFGITDEDVDRYRTVITRILSVLFDLRF